MAYQQKYYKEIVSQGHKWKLVILQDTEEALTPVEIGQVLQGLRLSVQGDQADIDTPIVKTSLVMTFVDAPDLEENRKCGYWEEFYTSSATEYKVELYKDDAIEWSGYITPDSFAEDLQYRGSVSITARDNLGALQDFEYSDPSPDPTGMVSLYHLYTTAMDVISCPMQSWTVPSGARSNLRAYETDIVNDTIPNVVFNHSAFVGKSWHDVLESVLYSTGMVLRYVGGNKILLSTIRDIPLYDKFYHWDVPIIDVQFSAYGHRELTPAVKKLIDDVQFEINENIANNSMPAEAYGERGTYTAYIGYNAVGGSELLQMPVFATTGGAWKATSAEQSLFLNPFAFPLKEGYSSQKFGDLRDENIVYIGADAYEENYNRKAVWESSLGAGKYRFSFPLNRAVGLFDNNTKLGFTDIVEEVANIRYRLYYINAQGTGFAYIEERGSANQGMNRFYWSEFTDINAVPVDGLYFPIDVREKGFPYNIEFPEFEIKEPHKLILEIHYIMIGYVNFKGNISKGVYFGIGPLSLVDVLQEESSIPQSLKTTTNYNRNNNILVQRNIDYGFNMGQVSSPRTILNGMYMEETGGWYKASDQWLFHEGDIPQPLSVLLHQQILAYYAKPNNLLTGELVVDNPIFNALYRWKGKNHIITSGTLNVLSGRMENVTLREFARYDFMWETWAEQDALKVDYVGGDIQVRVHSNKALTTSHLVLPSWISGSIADAGNGVYDLTLHITQNDTGADRVAIIEVDTALVKVEQVIAGDYGIDYGFDYS